MLGHMKLVLAVIQDADATALVRVLSENAFEVTKLASTGGFLREGNTTLMIGVTDERLEELKRRVQQTCRARTRLVAPSMPMGEQHEGLASDPVEVPVGGAVMFVMEVAEFVKV
ncbi:cyclic-di-AMP receptor [Deinococcus deserti]